MLISRRLAHSIDNRLQLLMYLVEQHDEQRLIRAIRDLSTFIHSHQESREDEHARHERENPQH